jgi:hypothetical protein
MFGLGMEIMRAVAETSTGWSSAAAGTTAASPAVINEKTHKFSLRIRNPLFLGGGV